MRGLRQHGPLESLWETESRDPLARSGRGHSADSGLGWAHTGGALGVGGWGVGAQTRGGMDWSSGGLKSQDCNSRKGATGSAGWE